MHYFLYPFILCLIPVHSLYAQNLSEISKRDYFQVFAIIEMILVLGFAFLFYLTGSFSHAALLLSVNFFLLFYANYLFIANVSLYKRCQYYCKKTYSSCYLIFCGALSLFLYIFLHNIDLLILNKILFYSSICLTGFIFLDIFQKLNISMDARIDNEYKEKLEKNAEDYPDIYHILLDSHAGFLNKKYYDSSFKEGLESRGFKIYPEFKSNYPLTHLSAPSMFNMEYIHNLFKGQKYFPSTITYPLYANNLVHNKLKVMGYECKIFVDKLLENIFFQNANKTSNTRENQLLKLVIYHSIIKAAFRIKTIDGYSRFDSLMESFLEDSNEGNSPKYRFMHTLAPHRPYYFDEKGARVDRSQLADDSKYFGYLKYVDEKVLDAIDKIKSKMRPNSIIIIHSDHGLMSSDTPFNILCAVYFPNYEESSCLSENSSLVNLFRCLFNKVFSCDYEILEDKFFTMLGTPISSSEDKDVVNEAAL